MSAAVRKLASTICLAALLLPIAAGGQNPPAPPAPPPPAAPPADPDFERALGAVQRGEIMPLSQILARIETQFAGRAIETEIETEDGRWVYEIEILTADGRLFEVDVDAVTGEIVDVEEEVD